MTPTLKSGFELLKEVGEVNKLNNAGTPHMFANHNFKVERDKYGSVIYNRVNIQHTINRQTLNKLIALGYAKYTDKERTRAIFVDKDQIERDRDWLVAIGKATRRAFDEGAWINLTSTEGLYDIDDLLKWENTI